VPLFLFSVLFGLSMDYQVFLLSRIQGGVRQDRRNRAAVSRGIGVTPASSRERHSSWSRCLRVRRRQAVMFQQVGFGLGVAVLLDGDARAHAARALAMSRSAGTTGSCRGGCRGAAPEHRECAADAARPAGWRREGRGSG